MALTQSLLVANRGEIAVRVLRTAKRLGLRTIAVYSEADRNAMHVQWADTAICIGAAPARDSYLNVANVMAAVKASGAAAVHPGYGFLSENAGFAAACAEAGVIFVGPPIAAIEAMGSKSESKRIMATAGVPLVPGYHGAAQDDALLAREAQRIGWPVLVKASAGGGGKGMRIVRDAAGLAEALVGARREALAAFGDATLLLEKYLERPRHVEVQVFADQHGKCVAVFDRDCSVQRRHQKVIEEAPAPGLSATLRQRMANAAIAAAQAVQYVGAGTVEFLVDGDEFYFIEMNTRLQVEHPVTEMVAGVDLVEWQLRVAAGEALPAAQLPAEPRGHAFEARLYAEDPARDFLPATGTLRHLRMPGASAHCRIDTGVREGDVISVFYDPMIAKLIVWGEDRAAALRALGVALAQVQVAGVATNTALLQAVAGHPAFAAGHIETGFIDRHRAELEPQFLPPVLPSAAAQRALALAALAVEFTQRRARLRDADRATQAASPWHATDSWRGLLARERRVVLADGELAGTAVIRFAGNDEGDVDNDAAADVAIDGLAPVRVSRIRWEARTLSASFGEQPERAVCLVEPQSVELLFRGQRLRALHDPATWRADAAGGAAGTIRSPMPGTVVEVMVAEGDVVKRGAPLLVVEAMKMEHTLRAPADGTVQALRAQRGARVSESDELLRIG